MGTNEVGMQWKAGYVLHHSSLLFSFALLENEETPSIFLRYATFLLVLLSSIIHNQPTFVFHE